MIDSLKVNVQIFFECCAHGAVLRFVSRQRSGRATNHCCEHSPSGTREWDSDDTAVGCIGPRGAGSPGHEDHSVKAISKDRRAKCMIRACDFTGNSWGERFELKSGKSSSQSRVADAADGSMIASIRSDSRLSLVGERRTIPAL